MSVVAKGPNGRPMVAVRDSEAACLELVARVDEAMRHNRIERHLQRATHLAETGETGQALRDRLAAMTDDDARNEILALLRSDTGRTTAWAVPRQIPLGPHAGRWYIAVPGNADGTTREPWISRRDPKTGEVVERSGPRTDWELVIRDGDVIEFDPAWWPQDEAG